MIHDPSHNTAHDSIRHTNRGSIMIWTVMLGFVLTSVFFFFGMRQRMMLGAQRDTIEQMNAMAAMESIADFLGQNPPMDGSDIEKEIDGIKIKLTREVPEITGSVDSGKTQSYNSVSGQVFVEWNPCSETNHNLWGDILVNGVRNKRTTTGDCVGDYKSTIGPLSVASLEIGALDYPVWYRIRPNDGSTLTDNQWHLSLSKTLDYGKILTILKTFKTP